jgi:crotonobetainyl-CoA:carnitine CoA-transferase CaiB-like acyl-CoA transferase
MLKQGLKNYRVVDFSNRIAGSYASKMFVDGGAEVIKVEPPQGDPLRKRSASHASFDGDSAFFKYLNGGKLSVVGEPCDDHIIRLIESADLVIETFKHDDPPLKALLSLDLPARLPHLVTLSISDYGRNGPFADRPATEFTLQADSGS